MDVADVAVLVTVVVGVDAAVVVWVLACEVIGVVVGVVEAVDAAVAVGVVVAVVVTVVVADEVGVVVGEVEMQVFSYSGQHLPSNCRHQWREPLSSSPMVTSAISQLDSHRQKPTCSSRTSMIETSFLASQLPQMPRSASPLLHGLNSARHTGIASTLTQTSS